MLLNCGAGEDSWESLGLQGDQASQSPRKPTLNTHWKNWCWSWSSNTLTTWCEELTHWKRPWCWERLRAGGEVATQDEMVGWHHWLNGHEFEHTPGDSKRQGSLVCCSPWGHKELDITEWLNNNSIHINCQLRSGGHYTAEGTHGLLTKWKLLLVRPAPLSYRHVPRRKVLPGAGIKASSPLAWSSLSVARWPWWPRYIGLFVCSPSCLGLETWGSSWWENELGACTSNRYGACCLQIHKLHCC